MKTKEEDILTSMTLIQKGLAVDRMLESVLIDPVVNIDDFLIGDKNALLMGARVHAYGSDYKTNFQCPKCSNTQEHIFDLSIIKNNYPSEEFMERENI